MADQFNPDLPEFTAADISAGRPTFFSETIAEPPTGGRIALEDSIGAYRLLELLGQGGMGEVWLAEQSEPVQRQVAIKIIRAGFLHSQAAARFAAERQTLAIMDHPAIAKVFEAGTSPEGQPYYTMEYVAGPPITLYCNQRRLSIRQRLELFIQVCDGVQHAHQKAILHRDLKPSNILVAEIDGHARPKIIDFGLAKTMTVDDADATLYTQQGQLLGTPGYMSPEQADPTCRDVDTRTDVYALGVILYRLLVDNLPIDPGKWEGKGVVEMVRSLREEQVPTPSKRVESRKLSTPEASSAIAQSRATEPLRLARMLRGDLDWITVKALEPDRERRYESVAAFAADLRRFLADEPVLAAPPSVGYRTRLFIRRHRVAVAAASAVAIMMVVLACAMVWQAIRIARERDRSNREAAIARQTSDFLTRLFNTADPSRSLGNKITVRQMLDEGAAQIQTGLSSQPDVQARLLRTIGDAYIGLGLYPKARPLLEKAYATSKQTLGADDPATLEAQSSLIDANLRDGDAKAALPLALDLMDRSARLAKDDPKSPALQAQRLRYSRPLAMVYAKSGVEKRAEAMDRERLAEYEKLQGPDGEGTILALEDLSEDEMNEQRNKDGLTHSRDAVQRAARVFGANDPRTLHAELELERQLTSSEHFDEAEKVLQGLIAADIHVLGPDHPATVNAEFFLGDLYEQMGQARKAEAVLLPLADRETRLFGPDDHSTEESRLELAVVYVLEGRSRDATPIFTDLWARVQRNVSPTEPFYGDAVREYAHFLKTEHRYSEAEGVLRPAIAAMGKVEEPGVTLALRDLLASVLMHEGKYDEAKSMQQTMLAQLTAEHRDPGDMPILVLHYNAACNAALNGHPEEALDNLEYDAEHGFPDTVGVADDTDLKSLHGNPRFKTIVARMHENTLKNSGK